LISQRLIYPNGNVAEKKAVLTSTFKKGMMKTAFIISDGSPL